MVDIVFEWTYDCGIKYQGSALRQICLPIKDHVIILSINVTDFLPLGSCYNNGVQPDRQTPNCYKSSMELQPGTYSTATL